MTKRTFAGLVASVFVMALGACEVQQQREAELPEVDVQDGQLPEYEVETGELEIREDTQVITVPEADVQMPDETTEGTQR